MKNVSRESGYKYQLLCRNLSYSREFEHCDYAKDRNELRYLIQEYRLAYGPGFEFRSVCQPKKYWN